MHSNIYCCSVAKLCPTLQPHELQHASFPLSFTISWSLLKLMSIESVMPFDHLILCRPLLLPPSIFPSIRIFFNESVLCIRWPKYQSLCNKTLLKYSYTYMINILHFILGKTECMSKELIVKVVFLLLMDRIHQLKPLSVG